ncbi:MBL fold metallo-hydrolase [Pectobacterium actinidiae]|uniref:MBL fold metallo-hydrolase n=1 Tax=Pectobacterium actinidiae TaxID=1507808 RepID=UPI004040AEC9
MTLAGRCSQMPYYQAGDITINRFIFPYINSNMYIILGRCSALVVDPHESENAYILLENSNVKEVVILLTHEHPDHTSGVNWLKSIFKSTLICQRKCAESILDKRNNRPILISFILAEQDKVNGTDFSKEFNKNFPSYKCVADIVFDDEIIYLWERNEIRITSIPGHSAGSVSIIVNNKISFTGDSLLKDVQAITRFPGGNHKSYNDIALPFFFSLDKNIVCFPGHGDSFIIGEKIHAV